MDKSSILVFDSGIGGMTVFRDLLLARPDLDFYYSSDSADCPFGDKTPDQLVKIVSENFEALKIRDFGAAVLACNTLTTTCMDVLSSRFRGVKFFGVRPPLEEAKGKKRPILICTEGTAKSRYVLSSAADNPKLLVLPVQELVGLVERFAPDFSKIDLVGLFSRLPVEPRECDALFLGCTHFCFLENNLKKIFYQATIFKGLPKIAQNCPSNSFGSSEKLKNLVKKRKNFESRFLSSDKKRNFELFYEIFLK